MNEGAYQLARLRAERVLALAPDERLEAERLAQRLGRRLVRLAASDEERRFLLDWEAGLGPMSGDNRYVMRGLTTIPLLTFACCLQLCWPSREEHPYPGAVTSEGAVLELAQRMSPGVTHIKSALRHTLPAAALVEGSGSRIKLGATVAAYGEVEVAALRRVLDLLPKSET